MIAVDFYDFMRIPETVISIMMQHPKISMRSYI